jgi:signal transduction histidine kinase
LSLRTTGVTAVAVFLLAIPLAAAVSSLYNGETTQRLVDDAARVAAAVPGPPLSASDPVEITAPGDGAAIGVYTPGGHRVAGSGRAVADAAIIQALGGHVAVVSAGPELVVALPVGSQEQLVGAVRAAVPKSAVDDRVRQTWLIMAAFCFGAIAVAGGLAVWQGRRLVRPLDALATGAARLGDGDFSARVAPSSVVEIDTVAQVLNQTSERLARVLERERAFSADASHQLRTPLTALRLNLESALRVPVGERSAEIVRALQEIDRLERTVAGLLKLARDTPGDRQPLDLAQFLAASEPALRARLAAAGRPFGLAIPDSTSTVTVSASAVRQVIDVLVHNAIDHGAGTVRIAVRELFGGVTVDVSDEGEGVSGDRARVFERRHSGDGGSGVGLALARSLAEAEGGRLELVASGHHPVFRLIFASRPPSRDPGR